MDLRSGSAQQWVGCASCPLLTAEAWLGKVWNLDDSYRGQLGTERQEGGKRKLGVACFSHGFGKLV